MHVHRKASYNVGLSLEGLLIAKLYMTFYMPRYGLKCMVNVHSMQYAIMHPSAIVKLKILFALTNLPIYSSKINQP